MENKDETDPAETSGYVEHAGSIWAPSNIVGGMSSVGLFSAVLGIVALVMAVIAVFPFMTWLLATIGVISGLRVFLPRVTVHDKVLIAIGVLTSMIAVLILLLRLAS